MTTQSVKEETAMASDWSGKLVIKARLGDDVRIIPIHNEDITFDELILMMQRVYRGTLTSSDDITIKYQDDDGDLITMFDCADLSYALHTSKVLKITIFPASEKKPLVTEDGVAVRNELVEINKKVSRLIECLEADKRIKEASVEVVKPVEAASGRLSALPVAMNEGKEFDPLSNASQQMNGLAQTGSIPGSSRGSVDSHAGGSYAPPVQKPTPLSGQQQQQQAQQQQQQQQQFPQQQSFPPQQPPQQQPTQQQSQQQQLQQPPQQQQQPYQQQQQHQPPYGHPSSHSKASQPPPSNNPNYPPHQASYLHNAPPSAGASASYSNNPPSNNPSYPSNPAYPNTSVPSFQPPQPVQTGIPGAPYTPYGQYKGPQSTGNYQQPPQPQQPNFYPQTGLPPQPSPSGGNPYSRGSGGPGQYPRPQYPTSH